MQNLYHEHIVWYYGHEKINEKLYIYLEYISGGNLSSVLNKYGAF
jgi:mitogen-activated protein kinase kinase kinase